MNVADARRKTNNEQTTLRLRVLHQVATGETDVRNAKGEGEKGERIVETGAGRGEDEDIGTLLPSAVAVAAAAGIAVETEAQIDLQDPRTHTSLSPAVAVAAAAADLQDAKDGKLATEYSAQSSKDSNYSHKDANLSSSSSDAVSSVLHLLHLHLQTDSKNHS